MSDTPKSSLLHKLWPYLLGLGVLMVSVIWQPQRLFQPESSKTMASLRTPNPSLTVSPGGQPDIAYYELIGEMILNKVQSQDTIITLSEYCQAIRMAGKLLQEQIKVILPPGLKQPRTIPAEWLRNPEYFSKEGRRYRSMLLNTNRNYFDTVTTRLVEDYGSKVMPPFVECIQNLKSLRKEPDEVARTFVHGLYGDDYLAAFAMVVKNSYAAANPKKNRTKKSLRRPLPENLIPPKEAALLDDEVTALWRTEFSDEELLMLKDLVMANEWIEALRDDLFFSDMPAVQHVYIQTTSLGNRLDFLHSQTQFLLNGKIQNIVAQANAK